MWVILDFRSKYMVVTIAECEEDVRELQEQGEILAMPLEEWLEFRKTIMDDCNEKVRKVILGDGKFYIQMGREGWLRVIKAIDEELKKLYN